MNLGVLLVVLFLSVTSYGGEKGKPSISELGKVLVEVTYGEKISKFDLDFTKAKANLIFSNSEEVMKVIDLSAADLSLLSKKAYVISSNTAEDPICSRSVIKVFLTFKNKQVFKFNSCIQDNRAKDKAIGELLNFLSLAL